MDDDRARKTREKKQEWERDVLKPHVRNAPGRPIPFTTVSGREVKGLYTPSELEDQDYLESIGFPGQWPYRRGIHPNMYRGRLWTMRQFSGFGSASDTNGRYRYLLNQGQTGLSVAFHLPTLMGVDSDHPTALGEVGRCGVTIDSLEDMETLFDGIPLDKITTSMTINAPASVLWAMYLAVAEKQGAALGSISGTIQNDILKEYIAQKTYIYPPKPSMRLITDTFAFGSRHVPRWNTISISGYHIREAGATALQELAFTLRDGVEYVEAAVAGGLDVDDFAPRLSFFFNAHNDLFEEVAKYRAARVVWARTMKDRFNARNPRSMLLRFHTQTAGCSLTAQQPYNNIVRVTIQALAGVLGGTQSLHTNSLDETLALPTEQAVTIALRTQQIIAHESGVANTVDPLGGSYFVERLPQDMIDECFEYFQKIDDMGGMVAAVEAGFPQREINESAYRYQKAIENREKTIVGVNDYLMDHPPIETLEIDPELAGKQAERLHRLRNRRDQGEYERSMEALRRVAANGGNTMPAILDAVKSYATLGEICDVFREVFGVYEEPAAF